MMYKKRTSAILSFLIALCMFLCACGAPQPAAETVSPQTEPVSASGAPLDETEESLPAGIARPQDDFFSYANAETLEAGAARPLDAMTMLVVERLSAGFAELLNSVEKPENKEEENILTMLDFLIDMERRNADGLAPLQPYLDKVDSIRTLDDFNRMLPELILECAPLPFRLKTEVVNEDNSRNILCGVITPSTYLPDVSFYDDGDPIGEYLIENRAYILETMAQLAGETEEGAKRFAADAIAFDKLIGKRMLSPTEKLQAQLEQKITGIDEFLSYSKNVDFSGALPRLTGYLPQKIYLENERLYKDMDYIVNEDNLEIMKAWMKAGYIYDNAMYLSLDFYFSLYVSSEKPLSSFDESRELSEEALLAFAYPIVTQYLAPEVSRFYDKHYLDEGTKQYVAQMCKDMLDRYKERMNSNDWLQGETKAKAVEKLDNIEIYVGDIGLQNPYTTGLKLVSKNDGGLLLENIMSMRRNYTKNNLGELQKRNAGIYRGGSDNLMMAMSYVTNAFYAPNLNSIVVSAGILNAPFYSEDFTDSQKYGAIGSVIGHEISHAFDQSGAQFDAKGCQNDWWTDEDKAKFQARSAEMIKLFDGLPYKGGIVDGNLTVGENTADAGGISISLELLSDKPGANLEEFFSAWAALWIEALTKEEAQQELKTDPHSPGLWRVNRQMQIITEYYDTYGVKEGDGMYLAPDERVRVW